MNTTRFMKLGLLIAAFVSIRLALAASDQSNAEQSSVVAELTRIENDLAKAVVARDYDALRRIEAETYVYTDSDARSTSREDFIRDYQTVRTEIIALRFDDIVVKTYGDAAVVSGRLTIEKNDHGKHVEGVSRYTRFYVHFAEGWRAVAGHSSRVVPH